LTTKLYQVDFEVLLTTFGSNFLVDFYNLNGTDTERDYFGFDFLEAT